MSRNMVELLLLALLFIGGWFWYDSLRAREHALRAGKGACENDGLQFLDDTVVCVNALQHVDRLGEVHARHHAFTAENRLHVLARGLVGEEGDERVRVEHGHAERSRRSIA